VSIIEEEDDMARFEMLLDKLIKEGKIDKLEVLRKLQDKSDRDSMLSHDNLLDEHIMNEQDSQHVDDEEHIPIELQAKSANNLYKFKNPDSDRPKTSNGGTRPHPEDRLN